MRHPRREQDTIAASLFPSETRVAAGALACIENPAVAARASDTEKERIESHTHKHTHGSQGRDRWIV